MRILDVEGVDAYLIGPNDLSASVGHIGRTEHPDMAPIYERIGRIMRERNRLFGVSVGFEAETIRSWLDRGARMIFAGNDVGYVHDGALSVLEGMRALTR